MKNLSYLALRVRAGVRDDGLIVQLRISMPEPLIPSSADCRNEKCGFALKWTVQVPELLTRRHRLRSLRLVYKFIGEWSASHKQNYTTDK
jgi:hypothetical protein